MAYPRNKGQNPIRRVLAIFPLSGKTYDLTRLQPKTVSHIQPGKGESPSREHPVDVIFSLHCLTLGAGNESPDPNLFYSDDRETRIFDLRRYAFSFQLPDIIDKLMIEDFRFDERLFRAVASSPTPSTGNPH